MNEVNPRLFDRLLSRLESKQATIGVVGLGYVGLPLVRALCGVGYDVIGFDIDPEKINKLTHGETYIRHLPASTFQTHILDGRFRPTTDFMLAGECDAILICVPTPLSRHRDPDLSFVEGTARMLAPALRRDQLIVLESTTYPGTTTDIVLPILEETGLVSGEDFLLAYSPEREDPGNPAFETTTIPKVVGGEGPSALEAAKALYGQFVKVVPVSSTATAEAVKITENIFRAVNIALVNELKLIYGAMGIDVWEVIDAAKTKPFGFMPFYPGPGLGGHCIPIDPFYLTWKAREYEMPTRFIELAGEINANMPGIVVSRCAEELNTRFAKGLNGSRILILGVAYKKNVDDIRESPAFALMEGLERGGAAVEFYDPIVAELPVTREHPRFGGRRSIALTSEALAGYDLVLIATAHDGVDYAMVVEGSQLIVDTRNAIGEAGLGAPSNLVKA
jgi:UDP-N-acetyl-D-glucosamine dehydrogenase